MVLIGTTSNLNAPARNAQNSQGSTRLRFSAPKKSSGSE
jgi:hypothetical protein